MPPKLRLDVLLATRGLFESRSQAARAVLAGEVRVGTDGAVAKPGMLVPQDVEVTLRERPRYASRGGLKLEQALRSFGVDPEGRSCLDAGASTGGFTDCLLQSAAARVIAVDVGYGQLDWRIRTDSRVTVLERRNVRELQPGELRFVPDLIVVDVSFIALAKVLPVLVACAAPSFDLLGLVKPQFELGRGRVGRGGVVRDPADRLEALVSVGEEARNLGLSVQGYCPSGVPGPAGNRESFIWCTEAARPGVEDLRAAAAAAEPETLRAAPSRPRSTGAEVRS
jgi:23S rRNA (cytidine1920-2'-O)/16S rRNA (cytidine1409-2'-O)-methyltransferase